MCTPTFDPDVRLPWKFCMLMEWEEEFMMIEI